MKGAWNLEKLSDAFSAATRSVADVTVKASRAIAKEVVHGVVGAECLLTYHVDEQPSASCGCWSIFLARNKNHGAPHQLVSAWVLDKRALSTAASENPRTVARRLETLIDLCKKDVQYLARLKHPSILRLIHPVEETRTQLVFLSEPVAFSIDDLRQQNRDDPTSVKLSELEIKHGLLQVSDGLTFLHNDAGIVHRAINPRSIVTTRTGTWKLTGFSFAVPMDGHQSVNNSFDYSDRDFSTLGAALHPPLNYLAPELVATGQPVAVLPSADVFSLALVSYELLAHRSLLPRGCSLIDYESTVRSLSSSDLVGAPAPVAPLLRQMLSPTPEARPPVASFAGCPYFLSDVNLRALKFLDSILQKSIEQRAAFLQDLPSLAAHFDKRVLLYNVLPPLLQELRTKELQAATLPIVMKILKVQSPEDFTDITLPALKPLLEGASGDTLLQLTQAAPLFQAAAGGKGKAASLIPSLLLRALKSEDVRCQEEGLKQVAACAGTMEYEGLKTEVLPAVHAVCLSTTSASVRVASFKALASTASRVDVQEAEQMLTTAATIVSVDKTAPTAMCVLGLGDALAKRWGARLAAERVLPAIAPLLVAPSLNSSQFATACKTVRDIVSLVEKSRGGTDSASNGNGSSKRPVSNASPRAPAAPPSSSSLSSFDVDQLSQWNTATATAPHRPSAPPTKNGTTGTTAASSSGGSMRLKMPGSRGPSQATASDWSDSLGFVSASSAPKATTAAVDPFAWPVKTSSSTTPNMTLTTASTVANKLPANDPLAGLWAPSKPTNTINSSTTRATAAVPAAAIDPFDVLALQHSQTGSQKTATTTTPAPPPQSLI